MRNIAAISIMALIVYVVWLVGTTLPPGPLFGPDPDAAYKRAMSAPSPTVVPRGALPGLSMVFKAFNTSAGGALAEMDLTFYNGNDFDVKDAKVKCSFVGASGTAIRSSTEVIYQSFLAGKTVQVRKVSFGIIPNQTKSASCELLSASKL